MISSSGPFGESWGFFAFFVVFFVICVALSFVIFPDDEDD